MNVNRQWVTGFDSRFLGQIQTFFVYNFPEDLKAKDIWHCFQKYGYVVDVFILGRKDKWGKRFGFVRMKGIQNVHHMEKRLSDIWFGSYKVRVKVADEREQRRSGKQNTNGRRSLIRKQGLAQPGKSYVQAVVRNTSKGKEANENVRIHVVKERIEETVENEEKDVGAKEERNNKEQTQEKIIAFSPEKEEQKWLDRSMAARVKSMEMITGIQERINIDGGLLTVSPLGGRGVLLTERVQGYLREYMDQNKELCDLWFDSIYPWEEAPMNKSRMVWLRISGVPLKAWCDRCFEMIGGLIGEVLLIHEDTKMKSILCNGKVLVICSDMSKVEKNLKLKVDEQLFDIAIVEEEWWADPDWWLSESSWLEDAAIELESSSPEVGDEDLETFNAGISGEDYDDSEEEQLQNVGDLNSNSKGVTVQAGSDRDGKDGLSNIGLVPCNEDGLEVESGPVGKIAHRRVKENRANMVNEDKPNAQIELELRDSKGKRKKTI
ncbi:hypothetical protein SLA2020_207800 [Shorea laevis]